MTRLAGVLRPPEGSWGWAGTVAVVAVAVVPQLAVQAMVPVARTPSRAALVAALLAGLVTLVSGLLLYLHHRLTDSDGTGWLSAGMIFTAGVWATLAGLGITAHDDVHGVTPLVGGDVMVLLGLLLMVHFSVRVPLPADPAGLGLLLAFCTAAAAIVVAAVSDQVWTATPWRLLTAMPLAGLGVLVALEVRRLTDLPAWAADRLMVAIAALTLGRVLVVAPGDAAAAYGISVAASTLAGFLLLSTSLTTLWLAIRNDHLVVTALQHQLATTAAQARVDRERLHEVKGTIAGIASASKLIHRDPPIPVRRRAMLEEMLERESARLQRLLHGAGQGPLHSIAVDDVLRPLVVARQAQGQRVTWQPSGARAWMSEDDLTAVLNILLENTARHAPGESVAVFVRDLDHHVEIVVADSGPGVPEADRHAVFELGTHGAHSVGQGIGLHLARRLMLRCGGYLRLDDSWRAGAAFVAGARRADLQTEGRCDDPAHVVAQ